jgi:hypothetical protein
MKLAFTEEYRGEAPNASVEGPNRSRRSAGRERPAIIEHLMEEVRGREDCRRALSRIKANKGSAGMDGMHQAVEKTQK